MPVRNSEATWNGDLQGGTGEMVVGDEHYRGPYSFASRFQEGDGTNPEELIAAAHAGCYSMALANDLSEEGFEPDSVHTVASVHLEDGEISLIQLEVDAVVPGIDEDAFLDAAEDAKVNCPVSQALAAVPSIELQATLS